MYEYIYTITLGDFNILTMCEYVQHNPAHYWKKKKIQEVLFLYHSSYSYRFISYFSVFGIVLGLDSLM